MTLRDDLKARTSQAHQTAEASWTAAEGFADLHTYKTWLTHLRSAHACLGRGAARALGRPDLSAHEERLCAALQTDLAPQTLPAPTIPQSRDHAWGSLYALHGSAIGASVLLKSGRIPSAWPRVYLTAARAHATSGALSTFFAALNTSQCSLEEACQGAEAVFARMTWLGTPETEAKQSQR